MVNFEGLDWDCLAYEPIFNFAKVKINARKVLWGLDKRAGGAYVSTG